MDCPYCAGEIDSGDRFCRHCGSRLAAPPPPGDFFKPAHYVGFGECPLGLRGREEERRQHNYGRPYLDAGAAHAHASWCKAFNPKIVTAADDEAQRADLALRSQSALFACGYSIGGLTPEERWRVLRDVAIPTLGLGEVVATIEFLVWSRESQSRDYSKAIREWRYDLDRIARHYRG